MVFQLLCQPCWMSASVGWHASCDVGRAGWHAGHNVVHNAVCLFCISSGRMRMC